MLRPIITGFHAIEERVKSYKKNENQKNHYKVYYDKTGPRVKKILNFAKQNDIFTSKVSFDELNNLVKELPFELQDHRGIVLVCENEDKNSVNSSNIINFDFWFKMQQNPKTESSKCVVLILDRITDPHNVGAILRSSDQFGVNLVILPEHKSSNDIGNNEIIARSSAGASSYVPFCIVNNLVRVTEQLKTLGFWIYGADANGENCRQIQFSQKSAIIMGNEGSGIATLLEKQCDKIVSIPTCGKIDSLNVSVATGILLYECCK